ncbi:hypothetical protein MFRU_003g02200 [Monilinia fructicola]|nr:hypothetical protein MFRU_003g02200 [Monilinia fructicola]
MSPKFIFLAGAPTSDSLNWDESNLLNDFTEPFTQFLHLAQDSPCPNSARNNITRSRLDSPTAPPNPDWRQLPLERQHLTTGISQDHALQPIYRGHGLDFFSTTTLISPSQSQSQSPSLDDDPNLSPSHEREFDETLSHFYEHSYAIHADIPSSQIAAHASFTSTTRSDGDASLCTSHSTSLDESQSVFPPSGARVEDVHIPAAGHLTHLRDLPQAQYLSSIVPQTMTVNLIVGLISISEPRAVETRRGGDVSLVEMLVGDETKSGFSINFWLSGKGKEEVRRSLDSLRVQDVVLVKNVALGSFQNRVHGQSLRKDMTKVWLLYREKIDRRDVGGCYGKGDVGGKEAADGQLAKVRRVRSWVEGFVGVVKPLRRGVKRAREELPPDTQ